MWYYYSQALRDAFDPETPAWARGVLAFLAVFAAPAAAAEEMSRSLINGVLKAGIGTGEHLGRAWMWAEQDEPAEAVADLLHSIVNFAEGFLQLAGLVDGLVSTGPKVSPKPNPEAGSLPAGRLPNEAPVPAAGASRDLYQLNRVANPTRSQVLRTLREIGTDESLATAKLISRGDVEVVFLPTDPTRRGLAGMQPFYTNRLEIYLDKLPATNKGLAGLVGHEAFHYVQGVTPGTYTLVHELEAYTWQARITGEVLSGTNAELKWMEQRFVELLQDPLYLGVRP
jgi:hypothetical protein